MKRPPIDQARVRRLIEDWQASLLDAAAPGGERRFGDFCAWLRDHHPECVRASRPATRPFWLRLWFERETGTQSRL